MTLALTTRLTVFYTAVFGVLLTTLGVVSYRVLASRLDADATTNLVELTNGLHGYLQFDRGVPTLEFDEGDADQAAFVRDATRYYQIYEANSGRLLVQSDAFEPFGVRFTPAEVRAFRDRPRPTDLQTDLGHIRISNSVISPAPDQSYLLQVAASLDPIDSVLTRFLALLLWSVPAGLLGAVLAGRWMAGLALAPLTRLATAANTIDVTNLQQRLPVRGAGDELDAVAQSFNETLGRLEEAVGEMRQFSTALAHELRTPLAALRGEIEMSLRDRSVGDHQTRRLASQLEELDKLKRLIDQILTLARAETGDIPLGRDPVDLGALSASLVNQLEPVAHSSRVDLSCTAEGAVVVEGDGAWLERLVLNLLDNAIKFTPPGGRVEVHVSRVEHTAMIEVRDNGAGIRPDVLPHIFGRFFRVDPVGSSATPGAGLGLSLARWIVERHNGQVEVASKPGEGAIFTIRLPLIKES